MKIFLRHADNIVGDKIQNIFLHKFIHMTFTNIQLNTWVHYFLYLVIILTDYKNVQIALNSIYKLIIVILGSFFLIAFLITQNIQLFTSQILMRLLYLCLMLFIYICMGQYCKNLQGNQVAWWVILKVPPKIGASGYAYIDINSKVPQFSYFSDKVDVGNTPLVMTLNQINTLKLQSIAWNDEHPDGKTSESLAHAKGVIAYSQQESKGFFISHSIPKYPDFVSNTVNVTIRDSQNFYGQNIICLSLSLYQLDKIAYRLLSIRPYIYQNFVKGTSKTINLQQLGSSAFPNSTINFQYYDIQPPGYNLIKSVFKNYHINCSIFEDAINNALNSTLIAETWGRPLQAAWCGKPHQVLNVINIKIGQVAWGQPDDHSKWIVAKNYACFGDMNRMPSQWKRGGAFYCIKNPNLVTAMQSIIVSNDKC